MAKPKQKSAGAAIIKVKPQFLRQFSFQMQHELLAQVEAYAEREGVAVSAAARRLIAIGLGVENNRKG